MEKRTENESLQDFLSEANKIGETFTYFPQKEAHDLSEDAKHMRELINRDKETDIELKKTYGTSILGILIAWLSFVGLIILGQVGPVYHKLSDEILITLITTSTANIILLPTIILKYLFPQNRKS